MGFLSMLSYLPIALYAESFRVHNALASVTVSSFAIPTPLTGCMKDFSHIWHLKPSDIISGSSHAVVSSLRHGNHFPLVNQHILDLALVTGRHTYIEDCENITRPVTVCVSFISPGESKATHVLLRVACLLAVALEIVLLVICISLLFVFGFYIGGILLACLLLNLALLLLMQWLTWPVFSRRGEITKDASIGAGGGAAIDTHVIVEHWNSSRMDVLVGFSSHLHALTNIPIRVKHWTAVVWIVCILGLLFVVQAATLASQIGHNDKQVFGSAILLFFYLSMPVPPRLLVKEYPDIILRHQPASVERQDQIVFSNRRTALAFISTLPWTNKAARWDWLDGFIPGGDRRKAWEAEMEIGKLGEDKAAVAKEVIISDGSRNILEEVRRVRSSPEFT